MKRVLLRGRIDSYLCFLEFIRDNHILNLRYSSKKSRVSENGLHRNVYELEKHSRGRINWSWFWDGLWCTDLHHVVAEEHHLEEEGDDYVEEDDWDDEYPAHARVRLKKWLMEHYETDVLKAYRLENGIRVCADKVSGYCEAHPCECPPQYCEWSDTNQLNGQVRSCKCIVLEIRWAATNRDRYPYELTIPPHRDRLNHTPFSEPIISQRNPQKCRPSQAVNVNERESGA